MLFRSASTAELRLLRLLTSLAKLTTGKQAVQAATPTVAALNRFAQPTPELAKNLSIVLPDLDTQSRAVERDPRRLIARRRTRFIPSNR